MANAVGEMAITGEQRLNRTAFDRWQAFCCSPRGTALMFAWAAAEATFWPVIPDSLLFPMAIGRQSRFRRLLSAALLGSALGGTALYLFAYFLPEAARSILPHLPVVQTFMIERAGAALDEQGVLAFWTQPWSGISYKVFAILGGARGLDPLQALGLSITARSLRMLVSSAVPRLLARRFPLFFRDYWLYFALTYLVIFGYGWASTQLFE